MDTEILIRILRERIAEVDPGTTVYTDYDLILDVDDSLRLLQAKNVAGMSQYAVSADPETLLFEIIPEPTNAHAMIMILQTAIDILNAEFRGRVRRGELGVSWRSGLEAESSISAAKEYRGAISVLEQELTSVILIQGAPTSATRPQ